jgi:hypothetical protein
MIFSTSSDIITKTTKFFVVYSRYGLEIYKRSTSALSQVDRAPQICLGMQFFSAFFERKI